MSTTIQYQLPKNLAGLTALIVDAINSASAMKEKIQIAAIAILYHTYQHGDYTKANDLILGLGHGVKRDSLVAFFTKFGGLQVNKEKPSDGFNGWLGAQYIKDNFETAKTTMWYDLKKDNGNGFEGYNLEEQLRKVINTYAKTMKKVQGMTPEDQAKVNTQVSDATIQQLLALVGVDAIMDHTPTETVEEQLAKLIGKDAA